MIMGCHQIYLVEEYKVEILQSELIVKHESVGMLELKHYNVVILNIFDQLNGIRLLNFLMLPDGKLGKTLKLVFIPFL